MGSSCCASGKPAVEASALCRRSSGEVLPGVVAILGSDDEEETRWGRGGEEVVAVAVARPRDGRLGLELEFADRPGELRVLEISGGALRAWNEAHPESCVVAGDVIVKVNGVEGNADRILDRLVEDDELNITLLRQSEKALLQEPPPTKLPCAACVLSPRAASRPARKPERTLQSLTEAEQKPKKSTKHASTRHSSLTRKRSHSYPGRLASRSRPCTDVVDNCMLPWLMRCSRSSGSSAKGTLSFS